MDKFAFFKKHFNIGNVLVILYNIFIRCVIMLSEKKLYCSFF